MKRQNALIALRKFNWMLAPVIGVATLTASLASPSYANGLLLAPTRLFFEGSSRSQELTVMNNSDKPQTYRLRLEDRRLKDTGEYDIITEPGDPTAASSLLRLSARQLVLPARSSGTVRVLLRRSAGMPAGEMRSHLVVTELPVVGAPIVPDGAATGVTIAITTIYGISIPILVRTGAMSARIREVTATRFVPPEHPELENVIVKVDAEGNRSVFVDVRLISTRQRRGEPIAVARSFALYAPLAARSVTLTLNAEQTARARAGGVVLQYQEVNRDGAPIGAVSEIAF